MINTKLGGLGKRNIAKKLRKEGNMNIKRYVIKENKLGFVSNEILIKFENTNTMLLKNAYLLKFSLR